MTTWEEIRDEVAGMLADGKPLEDVISKLEKRKNEMNKSKPMTNEEWLRQCTAMELAEFIRKQRDDWSDGWYSDCHRFEEIVEWLKEIHE